MRLHVLNIIAHNRLYSDAREPDRQHISVSGLILSRGRMAALESTQSYQQIKRSWVALRYTFNGEEIWAFNLRGYFCIRGKMHFLSHARTVGTALF